MSDYTNTQLLATRKELLTGLDRQRKFILGMAMNPIGCPACHETISQVAACNTSQGDVDKYPVSGSPSDDGYTCPKCHTALTYHLGLFGGDQWFETLEPLKKPDGEPHRDGYENAHGCGYDE